MSFCSLVAVFHNNKALFLQQILFPASVCLKLSLLEPKNRSPKLIKNLLELKSPFVLHCLNIHDRMIYLRDKTWHVIILTFSLSIVWVYLGLY